MKRAEPIQCTAAQIIEELKKFPPDTRVTVAVKKYMRGNHYEAKLAPALAVQTNPFGGDGIIIVGTQR